MKTTIKTVSFLVLALTLAVGCAQRGEGDDDTGPDAGMTGNGDLFPTGDYKNWMCYPSREDGQYNWNCNPAYNENSPTVEYVGVCRPLDLSGYWHGRHYTITVNDGRYSLRLDNTLPAGTVCEMTMSKCLDLVGDKPCWVLADESDGPYVKCGKRTNANGQEVWGCANFFKIVGPDKLPEPIEAYPATPPVY